MLRKACQILYGVLPGLIGQCMFRLRIRNVWTVRNEKGLGTRQEENLKWAQYMNAFTNYVKLT